MRPILLLVQAQVPLTPETLQALRDLGVGILALLLLGFFLYVALRALKVQADRDGTAKERDAWERKQREEDRADMRSLISELTAANRNNADLANHVGEQTKLMGRLTEIGEVNMQSNKEAAEAGQLQVQQLGALLNDRRNIVKAVDNKMTETLEPVKTDIQRIESKIDEALDILRASRPVPTEVPLLAVHVTTETPAAPSADTATEPKASEA